MIARVRARVFAYQYIHTYMRACRSKNGGDCQIDILNGFNGVGIIRMLAPSPTVELAEQIRTEEGSVLVLYLLHALPPVAPVCAPYVRSKCRESEALKILISYAEKSPYILFTCFMHVRVEFLRRVSPRYLPNHNRAEYYYKYFITLHTLRSE